MKFRITMKDPDAVFDCLQSAVIGHVNRTLTGASADEKAEIAQNRMESMEEFIGNWVYYGEYVALEFDTDECSARLLTAKEASEPIK